MSCSTLCLQELQGHAKGKGKCMSVLVFCLCLCLQWRISEVLCSILLLLGNFLDEKILLTAGLPKIRKILRCINTACLFIIYSLNLYISSLVISLLLFSTTYLFEIFKSDNNTT